VGGIRVQWEPVDLTVVPFQPSARPTSGISEVSGGWRERRGEEERQGERLPLELWLAPCNVQHGAVGGGACASGQRTLRTEMVIEPGGRSGSPSETNVPRRDVDGSPRKFKVGGHPLRAIE
jgi:hypothetical protein